jgi:hypothetical protein
MYSALGGMYGLENYPYEDGRPCVDPCHNGMAFAAGGGSLQPWRVAGNILNKQSRTA